MDISAQITEYENQLARLKSSDTGRSIERLHGAIAALNALKEQQDAEAPAQAEGQAKAAVNGVPQGKVKK